MPDGPKPWEGAHVPVCTEEDIYRCFRLMLGRRPSEREWYAHTAQFVGRPLDDAVVTYLSSAEFKNRRFGTLGESEHVLVDLGDFKMYVSPSDPAVGIHIGHAGVYEPHVTAVVRAMLRPGMAFVDVGANIGYFSLLAARLVGEEGRVFAFEPFDYNVKLLFLSGRANGFRNIDIFPVAASDRHSFVTYDNMGSNGVIGEVPADVRAALSRTLVDCVRIDDVLEKIPRLDMMKIDVEGAEYLALQGARRVIAAHRPVIVSEFAPDALPVVSNVSPERYLEWLVAEVGYELSVIVTDGPPRDCGRDVQAVMDCLRGTRSDHLDLLARPAD